jgi:hypothetical protein
MVKNYDRYITTRESNTAVNLHPKDYLLQETDNEVLAALKIMDTIRSHLQLTWAAVDEELNAIGPDWTDPGPIMDLSFLGRLS